MYITCIDYSKSYVNKEPFFCLGSLGRVEHTNIIIIQNNKVTQYINYEKFYEKLIGIEFYKSYIEEEFKVHYERLFKKPWKE